jgi:hypothetical protein
MRNALFSRRNFLRATTGTLIGLPWLESFSSSCFAATLQRAPVRFGCFFIGNGISSSGPVTEWSAKGSGNTFELGTLLSALDPVKDQLTVIENSYFHEVNHYKTPLLLSGHDRSSSFKVAVDEFTSVRPHSIDQVFAQGWNGTAEIPSLTLGCEEDPRVTVGNIAWRNGVPVPKLYDPGVVFDSLFNGPVERKRNKSILDFVSEDVRNLQGAVSQTDQRRLEEYLTSIREIETRMNSLPKEEGWRPTLSKPDMKRPAGTPPFPLQEYMPLMADLVLLAFRMNKTRVATLMLNHAGSHLSFDFLGLKDEYHSISHGQSREAHEKITTFHVQVFADFLKKAHACQEGERTLLESSVVMFTSTMRTGNSHDSQNIPLLIAGSGGGALKPAKAVDAQGKHIRHITFGLTQQLGMGLESLGDTTEAFEV